MILSLPLVLVFRPYFDGSTVKASTSVEYKFVQLKLSGSLQSDLDKLNALGKEGWIYVGDFSGTGIVILKP